MSTDVGTWAGIIAALATVLGLAFTMREGARRRAEADEQERAAIAGKAFSDGARSRDDEIANIRTAHASEIANLESRHAAALALMRSQRDDARAARDRLQTQIDRRRTT